MDRKEKAFAELNGVIRNCTRCRLYRTRTNVICGEGNLSASLMLIAQAPGKMEDGEGKMFIGPSGKVLNELLDTAGISRDEIYMTNLIKCRLPKDRRPKGDEIMACGYFLEKEIALIAPEVIATLGYYSTRYVLQKYSIPLPKSRAEFSSVYGELFEAQQQKLYPVPHPAALLYNRSYMPAVQEMYRQLRVLLESREPCTHPASLPSHLA